MSKKIFIKGYAFNEKEFFEIKIVGMCCACNCNLDFIPIIRSVCEICNGIQIENQSFKFIQTLNYIHCNVCESFWGDAQCCCERCWRK
jgi:hypothetical protein